MKRTYRNHFKYMRTCLSLETHVAGFRKLSKEQTRSANVSTLLLFLSELAIDVFSLPEYRFP